MDESQLSKAKATQEGPEEKEPWNSPAGIFGESNGSCDADEEEDGFDGIQYCYDIGSKLNVSKAASCVLKCEDIVDKEGSQGEGGEESSEDHDWVGGWEVGADEQVLLWCYFAEISQIGQWSHCDPSDEFEHTLFVFYFDYITKNNQNDLTKKSD